MAEPKSHLFGSLSGKPTIRPATTRQGWCLSRSVSYGLLTAMEYWSAVAAFFAALSSFLIMLIQRRNLLELVRPELVLTGWSRKAVAAGKTAHEVITFQTIKNVGRGAALHIHLHGIQKAGNFPTAVLSTTRLPILATNEGNDVNGQIIVWWKNVPGDKGHKYLPITINIFCWDSRGNRHETRYNLLAVELSPSVGVADEIAPGVMLGGRTTATRPMWLIKLFAKLGRIPGLVRRLKKAVIEVLKAGALYFAFVFGAGFVLGTIRTLWIVPRFSTRIAELMEAPIMFVVTILAARWVARRLSLPPTPGTRLSVGFVALGFLLVAEFTFVLWLRGLTIGEYVASRDPVAGTVYIVMLGVFAVMPLLVARR